MTQSLLPRATSRPNPPAELRSPAAPRKPGGFRTDIEGLRGIAVLLVVAFHVGIPGVGGGYVGVDAFFVLSGYLITGLLVQELDATRRIDLVHFYARRARRLLPASALMLLVTAAVSVVILAPYEQTRLAGAAQATSAYLSNAWFMLRAGDYFAADVETNPLLHTWSLAVEEQFYLVWPVVVMLGYRACGSRRRFAALLGVLCAVSFAGCVVLTRVHQPAAFYGSPARAWEFGLGGLAALIPAAVLEGRRGAVSALGWLGLATLLASGGLLSAETSFPGAVALVPGLGTAGILVAGAASNARGAGGVGRLLGARVLQWLGRLSYSWYLWHWPVLVLAGAALPVLPVAGRVVCAAASLGIAAVTFRLVESPIRSHRGLKRRPRASLALAGLATAACFCLAAVWQLRARRAATTPPQAAFTAAAADAERGSCLARLHETRMQPCVYGNAASPVTVVLMGDSHAAQWLPAMEQVARERGLRLVTLMKSGCPAVDVTVYSARLRRDFVECDEARRDALRQIAALRPAGVMLASALVYVRGAGGDEPVARLSLTQWRDGVHRTASALSAMGIPVLVFRDNPRPRIDVPVCLARAAHQRWRTGEACVLDRRLVLQPGVFRAVQDGLRGVPRTIALDLSSSFCGPSRCEPVRGGIVVYRDRSHLTASYALSLTGPVSSAVGDLLALSRSAGCRGAAAPAPPRPVAPAACPPP